MQPTCTQHRQQRLKLATLASSRHQESKAIHARQPGKHFSSRRFGVIHCPRRWTTARPAWSSLALLTKSNWVHHFSLIRFGIHWLNNIKQLNYSASVDTITNTLIPSDCRWYEIDPVHTVALLLTLGKTTETAYIWSLQTWGFRRT